MGEDNGDKKIKVDVAKIKVNLDNINYYLKLMNYLHENLNQNAL